MNYNKIIKSVHAKKSDSILLKEALIEVEHYTKMIAKYEKLQDLYYLNNAKEALDSAQAAVDFFKSKIK